MVYWKRWYLTDLFNKEPTVAIDNNFSFPTLMHLPNWGKVCLSPCGGCWFGTMSFLRLVDLWRLWWGGALRWWEFDKYDLGFTKTPVHGGQEIYSYFLKGTGFEPSLLGCPWYLVDKCIITPIGIGWFRPLNRWNKATYDHHRESIKNPAGSILVSTVNTCFGWTGVIKLPIFQGSTMQILREFPYNHALLGLIV